MKKLFIFNLLIFFTISCFAIDDIKLYANGELIYDIFENDIYDADADKVYYIKDNDIFSAEDNKKCGDINDDEEYLELKINYDETYKIEYKFNPDNGYIFYKKTTSTYISTVYEYIYNYNKDSGLINIFSSYRNGSLTSYTIYQYDNKKLTKEIDYDADENCKRYKTYIYDKNTDNLIKETVYDNEDVIELEYEYDPITQKRIIITDYMDGKINIQTLYNKDTGNASERRYYTTLTDYTKKDFIPFTASGTYSLKDNYFLKKDLCSFYSLEGYAEESKKEPIEWNKNYKAIVKKYNYNVKSPGYDLIKQVMEQKYLFDTYSVSIGNYNTNTYYCFSTYQSELDLSSCYEIQLIEKPINYKAMNKSGANKGPNDCNGFDIVIGNPPYFVITSEVHFKKEYEKQWEHLKSGRMNIYQIFFGLAGMISNSKGIVSFIHPKTLLSDSYLSSTRNYLCKTFNDITILNIVNRHDVFDNVLQAVIVSIWQKKKIKHCRVAEIQSKKDLSDTKYIEPSWGQFIDSDNKFIVSGNKSIYTILEKVSRLKTERFYFKTGNYEWNKLKQNLSANITKDSIRLIYGENIQRFWFSQSKKRINTTYINGTNVTIIDKPTIMTQRTTSSEQDWRIFATLINPKDFNYSLTSENSTNVFECNDLTIGKYYLGILNSRFMDFYFRIFNSNTHVSSGELNALPIPISTTSKKNAIIELVDKILELKRINNLADISSLELQIDEIVYDLFDLTEEEKSIIRV